MKEPSLFEAGCPRIEVAICRKSSSVMSGRNRLLTCDKRAFSAIDSSTTDSMSKDKGKATKALIPTKRKRRNWLNSYRWYYQLFRQQLMISPSGHSLKSEIHSFSIARLRGLLFPQLILYQSSIQQRLLLNRLLSLRLLHQARVTKARALRLSLSDGASGLFYRWY